MQLLKVPYFNLNVYFMKSLITLLQLLRKWIRAEWNVNSDLEKLGQISSIIPNKSVESYLLNIIITLYLFEVSLILQLVVL